MGRSKGPPTEARLMAGMIPEPNSGCWLWERSAMPAGYGKLKIDDKHVLAHRAAYLTWRGDIPEGLQVCHHCDVPACINPDHLFLGTARDNKADALVKKPWLRDLSRQCIAVHARPQIPYGDEHWSRRTPEKMFRGVRGPNSKRRKDSRFGDDEIQNVRRRAVAGETQRAIAAAYGVSQGVISRVISGKRYWTPLVAGGQ